MTTLNQNRIWAPNIFLKDMTQKDHTEGGNQDDAGDGSNKRGNEYSWGGSTGQTVGTKVTAATANVVAYTVNSTDHHATMITEIDNEAHLATGGTQFGIGIAPKSSIAAVFQASNFTNEPAAAHRYSCGLYAEMADQQFTSGGRSSAIFARHSNTTGFSFRSTCGIMYNKGEIRSGGDVIAFYSSDRRLKDNIFVIEDPIDKIKKISGVEFDWNEKGPHWTKDEDFGNPSGSLHDVGVIAQEVQKVLPEAVKERDNGFLAVKYEKIVPLLIEGIKDQQKQIESLEARIKKLENK
jgi:hypothetical protein